MKYYLKKFLMLMVYVFSSGLMGTSVLTIKGMVWLKLILLILNLALFIFIYCAIAFKDGEKAIRVRTTNDKLRELIVKTGDDYQLNLDGEFTVRKGFITGATVCLPLIFFLLLDLLIKGTSSGAAVAAQLFYMAFFGFFNLDFAGVHGTNVLFSNYYWTLIAIPFLIILQGVFFYLGGRNEETRQERIVNRHKII